MAIDDKEEKTATTLTFPAKKLKEIKIRAIEEDLTVSELLIKAFENSEGKEKGKK